MERRRQQWLRGPAGWSVCLLMAGCLYNHTGGADPATARNELKATTGDEVTRQATSEPPPEPLSNYHLLPVARSASVDPPLETIEMMPRLDGNSVPKSDPSVQTISGETSPPASPPAKEESPLVSALRCALEKHPQKAQALLGQYDPRDRDLLLALLSLTAGLGEGELAKLSPEEVEHTLDQLHLLTLHLRKRASLSLGTVCFCQKIENFGQFIPMPAKYEFQAGEGGRAGERGQVYAEVRNFNSILHHGQYETHLVVTLAVHDEKGQEVVTRKYQPCVDRSQTPRQDFFLNIPFYVFRQLPPGPYTLWVTVRDVTPVAPGQPGSARVARRSLDIRVCPSGTRPAPLP
jgi:hypothetical protein